MQQWHFKISGKVLIPGDNSTMNIHPENIVNIIRVSNYLDYNMPTLMARMNLDKNLLDKIILNAKTCTIYLKIEKFNKQSEMQEPMLESYIEDEFSVFIDKDVNYNKEIDYIETETTGVKREDVYKEAYIGLISKKCIDSNKSVANTTLYKTTMMNITASYMTDLHLLIEPFKYNPMQEQLIIPPQDTLVEIVSFLNSISVFYDTKYLFFIDEPFCTYLISRSGKGIEKVDEIYNDVMFNIRKTDDSNVATPGMMVDDEHSQYYIDINVMDTKYTIDHDTAKIVDKFETIINPNKENIVSTLSSIMDAKNTIGNITSSLTNQISGFVKSMGNIPGTLYDMKNMFTYQMKDELLPVTTTQNDLTKQAVSIINSIPEKATISSSSGGDSSGSGSSTEEITILPASDRVNYISTLNNQLTLFNNNYSELKVMNRDFDSLTDNTGKVFYDAQYVDNSSNAVSYINVQDVVGATKKNISNLLSNSNSVVSETAAKAVNKKHYGTDFKNNSSTIYSTVISLYNRLKSIQNSVGEDNDFPQDLAKKFDNLKAVADNLLTTSNKVTEHTNIILSTIDSFSSMPNTVKSLASRIQPMKDQFDKITKIDIKSKFSSLTMDIRTLSDSAKNALHKISDVGKGISTSLNYGDIGNIRENLNSIADLTGIGKLGISKFESNLKIGGCFGSGKIGTKVIRTKNDNPNEIKNVKTELENMTNKLSLNKYDLDPSVFTPNKRYIVKNYDAHNDKDGVFILNKKTEIYVREDDTFTCNVMLDLCKVAEDSTSTQAIDTQIPDVNNTEMMDWYKQSTGILPSRDDKTIITNNSGYGAILEKTKVYTQDMKVLGTASLHDILSKARVDKFIK